MHGAQRTRGAKNVWGAEFRTRGIKDEQDMQQKEISPIGQGSAIKFHSTPSLFNKALYALMPLSYLKLFPIIWHYKIIALTLLEKYGIK